MEVGWDLGSGASEIFWQLSKYSAGWEMCLCKKHIVQIYLQGYLEEQRPGASDCHSLAMYKTAMYNHCVSTQI